MYNFSPIISFIYNINSIVQGEIDMITIDGKEYDETKFSPDLQNY